MTHYMNLNPLPFDLIANGCKTIELRLYDEKRQQIMAGDTIIFTNTAQPNKQIHTRVINLHVFSSFRALYQALPLEKCGYLPEELSTASASDMNQYYPVEKQQQYGVVGIELELVAHKEG